MQKYIQNMQKKCIIEINNEGMKKMRKKEDYVQVYWLLH